MLQIVPVYSLLGPKHSVAVVWPECKSSGSAFKIQIQQQMMTTEGFFYIVREEKQTNDV